MEVEPNLPSRYPMPEATDRKRCWYRVQCTYNTRLQNGEVQGYRVHNEEKMHKRLANKYTQRREDGKTAVERERRVSWKAADCALNPVWCCWDAMASCLTAHFCFVTCCVKCSFSVICLKHSALLLPHVDLDISYVSSAIEIRGNWDRICHEWKEHSV